MLPARMRTSLSPSVALRTHACPIIYPLSPTPAACLLMLQHVADVEFPVTYTYSSGFFQTLCPSGLQKRIHTVDKKFATHGG